MQKSNQIPAWAIDRKPKSTEGYESTMAQVFRKAKYVCCNGYAVQLQGFQNRNSLFAKKGT